MARNKKGHYVAAHSGDDRWSDQPARARKDCWTCRFAYLTSSGFRCSKSSYLGLSKNQTTSWAVSSFAEGPAGPRSSTACPGYQTGTGPEDLLHSRAGLIDHDPRGSTARWAQARLSAAVGSGVGAVDAALALDPETENLL